MKKHRMKSFKRFKTSTLLFVFVVFIFLFPLLIGIICALNLPNIINVASGDLLSYYAVAFGILASYLTYKNEKYKMNITRRKELTPKFVVKINKNNKTNYNIDITNCTENTYTDIFFYGEFIDSVIYDKINKKNNIIMYDIDLQELLGTSYIDEDGLPTYFQMNCTDKDGNIWSCEYNKQGKYKDAYYYPDANYIL